jgi:hypothetical protein
MERSACILQAKGEFTSRKRYLFDKGVLLTQRSDGNIRYFEYENDKFEFLSEYKSGDPQRGLAFVPRRGINVSIKNDICEAHADWY